MHWKYKKELFPYPRWKRRLDNPHIQVTTDLTDVTHTAVHFNVNETYSYFSLISIILTNLNMSLLSNYIKKDNEYDTITFYNCTC